MSPPHDPISILGNSLNKNIVIKCKRQKIFKGILKSYDSHLNLLIEDVNYTYFKRLDDEEGTLEERKEEINKIILRGDSIVFIGLSG